MGSQHLSICCRTFVRVRDQREQDVLFEGYKFTLNRLTIGADFLNVGTAGASKICES